MSTGFSGTQRIREKLRQKYKDDLLLEEFTTPSDSGVTNHADAIGICLHPSRSTNIEYFEIKTMRTDWIKELKTPSKSEILTRYCHKIWLVTSSEDIARIEEIPDNWGWMYLKGQRLKILKDAPKLEPVFDYGFILRVAQYSHRAFNRALIDAEHKAYDEAKIKVEKIRDGDYWKDQANRYKEMYEQLLEGLELFNKITGCYLTTHNEKDMKEIEEVAKLLRALLDLKREKNNLSADNLWGLGGSIKNFEQQLNIMKNALKEINKTNILQED